MTRPTAVIVGCGDLGTETGLRLAAEGWTVIGVRRSPERLPAALRGVAADLTGPLEGLAAALPERIDGLVMTPSASDRTEEAYRAAYLDAPERLLGVLDRSGRTPRRIIAVGSTAVHGNDDGSEVDEDTPLAPTTPTARVLAAAESALHALRPDAVILRLAGLYGPGRTGLIERIRRGEAVVPDRPVLTNRIHRDDAAAAIVHLLSQVTDPAPSYLGVDHTPVDRGEVIRFLAAELGMPSPPVGEVTRRRGGNKRLRNDRLVGTGFRFTYPSYREGYRAVLAGEGTRHQ